ncbi:MAG: SufE family protein [Gemmatimonadota bacterium]
MSELDTIIRKFSATDRETRLQQLLHYSRKLPALPARFVEARDRGENKVHECQSPVFLYTEMEDGRAHLYADAPPEAPTVRGFVSMLGTVIDGARPAEVAAIPDDLLDRLGLTEILGMNRMQGLTAVLGRIKRMVKEQSRD